MDRHTTHAVEGISASSQVTYAFESTLACVRKAEMAAGDAAARAGFDSEDCTHISVAICEAVTNAVTHGNHLDPAKHVTVALEIAPGTLTVAVRDEGPGWDPASIPDALAPENLLKVSGRGIFLIRAFMDEVRFAGRNEIIMTKFVRGSDRDGSYPVQPDQGWTQPQGKEPTQ